MRLAGNAVVIAREGVNPVEAAMLGSLRVTTIALATCFAATAFNWAGAANAQTVVGPVRGYQVQTPPQPAQPSPRTGVTGFNNQTQDVIREPRFIVEAIEFKAVDETGPNNPGSDEIFAVFDNPQHTVVTGVYGNVDTDDVVAFPASQNCIWPAVDLDVSRNQRWQCNAQGGSGPVSFGITLYEIDPDYDNIIPAGFCITLGSTDLGAPRARNCDTNHSDIAFRADFTFGVSDILAHLDQSCRCWTQTARYRETDWRGDLEYQVTFRITRVDDSGEPPAVDLSVDDEPIIHRGGTIMTTQGRSFELDNGGTPQTGGDLNFTRAGGNHFLTPAGGAKIWVGGATPRGYGACFAQRMSANYVATQVSVPAIDSYACYVTSEGRVGEFRVDALSTSPISGNSFLTLSYTTWQ
jgi:hypothetical protein